MRLYFPPRSCSFWLRLYFPPRSIVRSGCALFSSQVLFVLDAPLNFRWVLMARLSLAHHCAILNRLIGKGVFLIFLSCRAFDALYGEHVLQSVGLLLAAYMAVLGLILILLGLSKTMKLNRVRLALQERAQFPVGPATKETDAAVRRAVDLAARFCNKMPGRALTLSEFAQFSKEVYPTGASWTDVELRHVVVALTLDAHALDLRECHGILVRFLLRSISPWSQNYRPVKILTCSFGSRADDHVEARRGSRTSRADLEQI